MWQRDCSSAPSPYWPATCSTWAARPDTSRDRSPRRGHASSASSSIPTQPRRHEAYCAQVLVGDVETMELPFEPGSFDVMLRRPRRAPARPGDDTRAAAAAAPSGGRLVLSTPNVANWAMRLSLLAGRWRYTERGILDRSHAHLFTRKTLAETIEPAGYRIVEIDYTVPVPPSDASRRPPPHAIGGCGRRSLPTSSSSLRRRRDLGRHSRQERRCRSRALPRRHHRPEGRGGGRGGLLGLGLHRREPRAGA